MITIAIATFSCLRGNYLDRVSHFSGWQLIRLLQVFEFMRHSCVLANLCGCFCWALAPFAVCFAVFLMVRRKSGWGSASCLVPLVVCVLVFMICQAACDHLCPCRSFLNSFFSCKDRASERDRPYQRKKKQPFATVRVRTVWPCLW